MLYSEDMKKITKNLLAVGVFVVVMGIMFIISRNATEKTVPATEGNLVQGTVPENQVNNAEMFRPKENVENGISNWKTFNHAHTGLSIKYPPDWVVVPTSGNYFGFETRETVESEDVCYGWGCKLPTVGVVKHEGKSISDHIQFISEANIKILTQENLVINGKKFTKLFLSYSGGAQEYRYLYEEANALFSFDLNDLSNGLQYLEILEDMLSTFQLER